LKSVINCFTKIWQDVVSLIDCIDKSKNTKLTGLNEKGENSGFSTPTENNNAIDDYVCPP
jgi:hypothetical protein